MPKAAPAEPIDTALLRLRVGNMRLKPGDILVLHSDKELSTPHERHIREVLRSVLPAQVKSLILTPGFRLSTVTFSDITEALAENAR
jgi:hypothetical protein